MEAAWEEDGLGRKLKADPEDSRHYRFGDKKEVLFLREIKTAHLYDCQLYST